MIHNQIFDEVDEFKTQEAVVEVTEDDWEFETEVDYDELNEFIEVDRFYAD